MCQRGQRLHRHGVSIVNTYAETVLAKSTTTRKLFAKFEGFSQILKEQSDEKIYLHVFTHPIAKTKNFKNLRI